MTTQQLREFAQGRMLNTIFSGIAAFGTLAIASAVLIGYLSTGTTNTHDIQMMQGQIANLTTQTQGQMAGLTAQVEHLANKIDPAIPIQLHEIDRHLSALDGRMDGMDARARADELSLTRAQTEIESIRNSSDAQLRGHVR